MVMTLVKRGEERINEVWAKDRRFPLQVLILFFLVGFFLSIFVSVRCMFEVNKERRRRSESSLKRDGQ